MHTETAAKLVDRYDVAAQPRIVAMRRQMIQTYGLLQALEGPLGDLVPYGDVREATVRELREAWRDEAAAYERAVAEAVEALRRERAAEA